MKYMTLLLMVVLAYRCTEYPPICVTEVGIIGSDFTYGTSSWTSNIGEFVDASCGFGNDGGTLWYISMSKWTKYCDTYYISIRKVPKELGNQQLMSTTSLGPPATAHFIIFNGDDAIAQRYVLTESETNNWIHIESINADSTIVTGTYNLSFVLAPGETGWYDPSLPDTLHFIDGTFIAQSFL